MEPRHKSACKLSAGLEKKACERFGCSYLSSEHDVHGTAKLLLQPMSR